jgi:hypothetical protein
MYYDFFSKQANGLDAGEHGSAFFARIRVQFQAGL